MEYSNMRVRERRGREWIWEMELKGRCAYVTGSDLSVYKKYVKDGENGDRMQ